MDECPNKVIMTGVTKMIEMTKVTKVTDLSEDDKDGDPVKFKAETIVK